MLVSYGYSVRWREKGGAWVEVSINGCPSINEAFQESFAAAKRFGYRRPRFWELVRKINEIDYEKRAATLASQPTPDEL